MRTPPNLISYCLMFLPIFATGRRQEPKMMVAKSGNLVMVDETKPTKLDFDDELHKSADPDDVYDELIELLPSFDLWKRGRKMGITQLPLVMRKKPFWSTPLGVTVEGVWWMTTPNWLDMARGTTTTAPEEERRKEGHTAGGGHQKVEAVEVAGEAEEAGRHGGREQQQEVGAARGIEEEDGEAPEPEQRMTVEGEEEGPEMTSSTPTSWSSITPVKGQEQPEVMVPPRRIVSVFKGIPVADERMENEATMAPVPDVTTTTATIATRRGSLRKQHKASGAHCRVLDAARDGQASPHNDESCPLSWPGIPADDSCKCNYEVSRRDERGCAAGFIYSCTRVQAPQ